MFHLAFIQPLYSVLYFTWAIAEHLLVIVQGNTVFKLGKSPTIVTSMLVFLIRYTVRPVKQIDGFFTEVKLNGVTLGPPHHFSFRFRIICNSIKWPYKFVRLKRHRHWLTQSFCITVWSVLLFVNPMRRDCSSRHVVFRLNILAIFAVPRWCRV